MLIENTSVGFEGFYTFETRNKDTGELTQSLTVKNRITRGGARVFARTYQPMQHCTVFREYIDESNDIIKSISGIEGTHFIVDRVSKPMTGIVYGNITDFLTPTFNKNGVSYLEYRLEYSFPSSASGVVKAICVSDVHGATFSQTNIKTPTGDLSSIVVANNDVLIVRYVLRIYGDWHKPLPSYNIGMGGVTKRVTLEHHPDMISYLSTGTTSSNILRCVLHNSLVNNYINMPYIASVTVDGSDVASTLKFTNEHRENVSGYVDNDNKSIYKVSIVYKNTTTSNKTVTRVVLAAPFNLILATIEGGVVVPPQGTFSVDTEIEWCNTVPPRPPTLYTNPTNNKSAINPVTGRAFDINPDY